MQSGDVMNAIQRYIIACLFLACYATEGKVFSYWQKNPLLASTALVGISTVFYQTGKFAAHWHSNTQREHGIAFDQKQRKPFVQNPNAGLWFRACTSGNLVLCKAGDYASLRESWENDCHCPFTVIGHGNAFRIRLDTPEIHQNRMSAFYAKRLETDGHVILDAEDLAELITTAPNYKKGQHIHLFSCEGGAWPDGIAQQLADEMQVPVSAFIGKATSIGRAFGSISIEKDELGENTIVTWDTIKTFYPRLRSRNNITI